MSELTFENQFSGVDLLHDPRSLVYFEMKTVLIHYFSLGSLAYRRNFNLEARSAIDTFNRLPATERSALHQLYTIGYREPEPALGKTRTDNRRVRLLQSIPSARNYFSIDDLADGKTLNTAYRRNAKIYHPDSGGSHEVMVELNSIFSKLHEKIATDSCAQPTQNNEGFQVTKDYVEIDMTPMPNSTWCNWLGPLAHGKFSSGLRVFHPTEVEEALALLQASIATDEYDLRTAVTLFKPILKKIHNGRNDFGRNAATIEASIQLCRRLRAAQLDAEAAEMSLNIRSSKLKLHPYWSHMEKALEQVMNLAERPKVNPLHPRQRGNLEKFDGAAKVGSAKRLLRAKQTKEKLFCDAITALGGFITLPTDPVGVPLSAFAIRNVPQVNSSTPLSADQISEYYFTFYESPTLEITNKHLNLRCEAWFSSLFDANVAIDRLLMEIKTVADFISQTLYRTPVRQRIECLIPRFTFMDFVDVLLGSSSEEIRQRLDLLAAIHNRYSQAMLNWITTHVIQNTQSKSSGFGLRDTCFPDVRDIIHRENLANLSLGGQLSLNPVLVRSYRKEWFKAACAPIAELKHALELGWMTDRETTIERALKRCLDYSQTQALIQKLWWEDGARYALEEKNDRLFKSIAIKSMEVCYAHLSRTEFTEELHFGWWATSIAKLHMREGNQDMAKSIAAQFFDLPVRAHAWTSEKEFSFLKRLNGSPPKE